MVNLFNQKIVTTFNLIGGVKNANIDDQCHEGGCFKKVELGRTDPPSYLFQAA
jgi:hypothetical protein